MVSMRKKTNMKYGFIIGAVVGVALFGVCYTINNSWSYLLFIPLAAAMGWATQYVRDDEFDD